MLPAKAKSNRRSEAEKHEGWRCKNTQESPKTEKKRKAAPAENQAYLMLKLGREGNARHHSQQKSDPLYGLG